MDSCHGLSRPEPLQGVNPSPAVHSQACVVYLLCWVVATLETVVVVRGTVRGRLGIRTFRLVSPREKKAKYRTAGRICRFSL
jgi:hypothetical protein